MLPAISIVTVVYNGATELEGTILSVINQTYKNIEFIIIDGGSTDGTIEIIKKYADNIHFWISEPDYGIYDAMNKALERANGDWVFFLGGDDLLYNNRVIENFTSYLKDENAVYYGNALFKTSKKLYDVEVSKLFFCLKNVSHQTIFYPKSIYKKKNYNVRYKIFADHIYNLELYLEHKFEHIPLTTVIYNDTGRSSNTYDKLYFDDLPTVIHNKFGAVYGFYVYIRLFLFKTKRGINPFY